jgi:phage tail-like protein
MTTVLRRWRPLAAVAAAILAFVLVPQGTRAGAVPLTAPVGPGDDVIVRWVGAAGTGSLGDFQQCSGFGSRSTIVQSNDGTGGITKSPGATSYPDVTCTHGIIRDDPVYGWRGHIEAEGPEPRAVVLSAFNAAGELVQEWALADAWPSQYIQAFDRVVIVFTADRVSLQ